MNLNPRPLFRLVAASGLGGVAGHFIVGGPLGIVGGILLGALGEEVYARLSTHSIMDNPGLPAHGDYYPRHMY
jgi:hypothetical protein